MCEHECLHFYTKILVAELGAHMAQCVRAHMYVYNMCQPCICVCWKVAKKPRETIYDGGIGGVCCTCDCALEVVGLTSSSPEDAGAARG